MSYCDTSDMLVKDVIEQPGQSARQEWIDRAAREMDSKLGFIYVIPVKPAPPSTELKLHEQYILRDINAKIASGRMLMSLHQNTEDQAVHAYARSLLREGINDLMAIANGDVLLTSAELLDSQKNPDRTPGVVGVNEPSLVDAHTLEVNYGIPTTVFPGVNEWPS